MSNDYVITCMEGQAYITSGFARVCFFIHYAPNENHNEENTAHVSIFLYKNETNNYHCFYDEDEEVFYDSQCDLVKIEHKMKDYMYKKHGLIWNSKPFIKGIQHSSSKKNIEIEELFWKWCLSQEINVFNK